MHPLDVAHTYFDAWNRRDPAAIVATFAEGSDPRNHAVCDMDRSRALAVRQDDAGAADRRHFRLQISEFRSISEFKNLQPI